MPPELLREVTARAKKQIRARMRRLRESYPRAALDKRSRALCDRLLGLPLVESARSVASFWPLVERGEVDLRPLDAELRKRGIRLYYPFMDATGDGGYRTGFRLTESSAELVRRGQRFAEPSPEAPVAKPGDVDVVIVPALAADARGHRIGYGAGYYDATLADVAPPARSVIAVYDFQLLAEVPAELHDVPGDWIVSDERSLAACLTPADT